MYVSCMETMTLPCIPDPLKFPMDDNGCSISDCQAGEESVPSAVVTCNGDDDVPATTVKKRRNHHSMMRRSLSESSSASYDSAIIGEAHGLITDMLADTTLPPHVVSGLRAVSNLLKPSDCHSSIHKTRVSPLVSLTESTSYGSDSEESPYTGERPSSLPKRLRRSLPPSLLRRMSTSTWTTTTSATGMPTLELEPCRVRSSSFRHSRDATPGSSPVESRSNSPSPSSPTVVLTIPKSRSFSLAATQPTPSSHLKKLSRKSVTPLSNADCSTFSHSKSEKVSPLVKGELDSVDERLKVSAMTKEHLRKNVTSDYESCNESPSSSDHSDNILNDEIMGSPPKKLIGGRTDMSSQIARVNNARDFLPISDHTSFTNSEDFIPNQHVSDMNTFVRPRPQFPHKRDYHVHQEEDESHDAAADDEDDGDDDDDDVDTEIRQSVKQTDSSSKDLVPVVAYEKTDSEVAKVTEDKLKFDIVELDNIPLFNIECLNEWDYPIFEAAQQDPNFVLSKIAYRLFMEVGLFETFRIPIAPFINYFHALEMGYRNKPYHNRVHATDVLHGVFYLTTQPIPGFVQVITTDVFSRQTSSSDSEGDISERSPPPRANSFAADDSYGIMGGNFPALELMALYTAAAMHDYDHPGRTNAFLVATNAPQAVLYNDRSVLENHHAAAAWNLFLSDPNFNFLSGLDQAEFKRFRYLVIESILATDLKRHFEILAEFNAKTNDDPTSGVDWTVETDRLLIAQMVIKLADINGPAKTKDLHTRWTSRISEEFYEQGDEEARLGMPISPYMDRRVPQLSKLQETFINHLVAPLCNTLVAGGLLPGTWVDEDSDGEGDSDPEKCDSACKDTEDENETDTENGSPVVKVKKHRRVNCLLTKNMKDNHTMWVAKIEEEEQQKALSEKLESIQQETTAVEKKEMESIKEESESPSSMSPTLRQCDKPLPLSQYVLRSQKGDKCLTSPKTDSKDSVGRECAKTGGSDGSRDNT